MSRPLEHDYIGLSMEAPDQRNPLAKAYNGCKDLNLKATKLRLGLPGSESPERKLDEVDKEEEEGKSGYPICMLKSLVSGAKRGFSDVINGGSGKWVLAENSGFEADLGKAGIGGGVGGGGLLSPRAVNGVKSPGPLDGGCSASSRLLPLSPFAPKEKQTQSSASAAGGHDTASQPSKAQVVGWPPIRSFRKNSMASSPPKPDENKECKTESGCLYVKVSMEGAPYLRKVDLKTYHSYVELSSALEKMFSCFTIGQYGYHGIPGRDGLSESRLMDLFHGSENMLTYEDKDGDWMLVGDVPWEMFIDSCRRLRIMKSSEAIGLVPRPMEKS